MRQKPRRATCRGMGMPAPGKPETDLVYSWWLKDWPLEADGRCLHSLGHVPMSSPPEHWGCWCVADISGRSIHEMTGHTWLGV